MADKSLAFEFSAGVLLIGDASHEMRIEWGDAPRARRKKRHPQARWREFWPDFRLLRPVSVSSTDEEQTRKSAAFEAFRAQISEQIAQIVEGFPSHQWIFLKLIQESKIFRDLAQSNRVLAYCVANNAEFTSKEESVGAKLAVPHCAHKQKDILTWLGFPGKESVVKLLRRLDPEVASLGTLRYLKSSLHRDPKVSRLLAHQSTLGCGVIALACSPATTHLVSHSLLKEVAASADEFDRAPTAEHLEHAMDLMRRMHDTRQLRPFRTIAEVNTFHDETAAQYQAVLERWAIIRKKKIKLKYLLPDPPIPGTPTIVPITTEQELKWEGREQCNCVGSYLHLVRGGDRYIYRVLAPERATLEITLGPDGAWRCHDLRLKANRLPSRSTIAHVNAWLYQHSLSA
ncbi:MAG: hypothetical protein HN341_10590 [Verrucomicrobia bacterium]|jgi:hypothetical protein|nr:hypothetical protein [Verrucomicrobiota bacterium]MBT7064856.1 hypothetical protein [Verrucomicrobiota bacterium]